MKKIKNMQHLREEQQKLLLKRIRLEDKIEHQWQDLMSSNKTLINAVSWGYSLLSGRWWAKAAKKWFNFFK